MDGVDDDDDDELTDEERSLLELFRGLRPASRYHLLQALAAREVDGITGTMVVKIPRSKKDAIDVAFVGAEAELLLRI